MPPLCPLCRDFESECSCTGTTRLAKRWACKVLAGTWVIPGDFYEEEGEYGPADDR